MVEGCFAWVNGKSTPLTRYWVGDRVVKLATSPSDKYETIAPGGSAQHERIGVERPSDSGGGGGSWLGLFTALLMGACGYLMGRIVEAPSVSALQSEVYSLLEFAAVSTAASKDL